MNFDLIFGGVGGQGILSIAYVLDNASLAEGLHFKQSEVHGMAQRGGAVSSHLRVSDQTIYSDLVPLGGAHLLLAVEPMEAVRYLDLLGAQGRIVSSTTPEVNIPDYPDRDRILDTLLAHSGTVLVDAKKVAKEAGSHRSQNMVMLGAAAPYIPLPRERMESLIGQLFSRKGQKVIDANLAAFHHGLVNGQFFLACVEAGADPKQTLLLMQHLESATIDPGSATPWCELLQSNRFSRLVEAWGAARQTVPGDAETARRLLAGDASGLAS